MDYDKALAYATEKHNGQVRYGGDPYITHPIAVSNMLRDKGYGLEYQIAGLFHDLLEDTDATEDEILALSNEKVLAAVKALTKFKGYVMSEYVDGIRANEIAFVVKGADRLHNLRSAICAGTKFVRHYIEESEQWYEHMYRNLYPEITVEVETLKRYIGY